VERFSCWKGFGFKRWYMGFYPAPGQRRSSLNGFVFFLPDLGLYPIDHGEFGRYQQVHQQTLNLRTGLGFKVKCWVWASQLIQQASCNKRCDFGTTSAHLTFLALPVDGRSCTTTLHTFTGWFQSYVTGSMWQTGLHCKKWNLAELKNLKIRQEFFFFSSKIN